MEALFYKASMNGFDAFLLQILNLLESRPDIWVAYLVVAYAASLSAYFFSSTFRVRHRALTEENFLAVAGAVAGAGAGAVAGAGAGAVAGAFAGAFAFVGAIAGAGAGVVVVGFGFGTGAAVRALRNNSDLLSTIYTWAMVMALCSFSGGFMALGFSSPTGGVTATGLITSAGISFMLMSIASNLDGRTFGRMLPKDEEAETFNRRDLERRAALAESSASEALTVSRKALERARKVELEPEEIQRLFNKAIGGGAEAFLKTLAYQNEDGREAQKIRRDLLTRLEHKRKAARLRSWLFFGMAISLGLVSAYIVYDTLFPSVTSLESIPEGEAIDWTMHNGVDALRQILAFSVLNVFAFFFFATSARASVEVSATSQEIITINLWLFAYSNAVLHGKSEIQDQALLRILNADRNPVIDKSKTSLELAKAQLETDNTKMVLDKLDKLLEVLPTTAARGNGSGS